MSAIDPKQPLLHNKKPSEGSLSQKNHFKISPQLVIEIPHGVLPAATVLTKRKVPSLLTE
jgi:hypothetical protein